MSKVHRFTGDLSRHDFSWDGVPPLEINTDIVHGVIKHVLVGPEDEAPISLFVISTSRLAKKPFLTSTPTSMASSSCTAKPKCRLTTIFMSWIP